MRTSFFPRKDKRPAALVITLVAVLAGGAIIAGYDVVAAKAMSLRSRGHAEMARRSELENRWQQGIVMLHARQFDNAATAFHRVLELSPKMPEAHVNMGFALIGLKQYAAARDFFETATELKRDQLNAYYGLAMALGELGDYASAVGAMRTYIHRTPQTDPFRRKAAEALLHWETAMRSPAPASPDGPSPGGGAAPR